MVLRCLLSLVGLDRVDAALLAQRRREIKVWSVIVQVLISLSLNRRVFAATHQVVEVRLIIVTLRVESLGEWKCLADRTFDLVAENGIRN